MPLRVLVVDDTVVFRRAVADALSGLPDVEVAGLAANGKIALWRLSTLHPDLLTLDLEMPEMNGIQLLEQMRAAGLDVGVIVVSALSVHGGELTIRALELGAFDFITKPESGTPVQNVAALRALLQPIVEAFKRKHQIRFRTPLRTMIVPEARAVPAAAAVPLRTPSQKGSPIVLIGVSTGGPAALASLLRELPANLAAPVLIVQHMPPLFTQPLAASLALKSPLPVREAADGERARDGCIYLAPGGRQMKLGRGTRGEILIQITNDPPENNCKPAVDYLFRSAALQFPGRAIAAILTGMGNDGAQGLRLLKNAGCMAIAQDEDSCVVFGMPKEAIQTGLVDLVLPLDKISAAIARAVSEARP
jgi:two-component system chemotaxis response regulator CheB